MDADLLPHPQMIKIAARGGALAQGRIDCGVIKPGARADFAVLNLNKPHMTPSFDPLSNAVFSAQASDVEMTVVDGKIVYRSGEFSGIDIEKVKYMAEKSALRIASEL